MKQVTVVIPNYNGEKYLLPCLEALYRNTEMEIDVIVVDNHSTDNSIEGAKARYPQITYVQLEQNFGFSRAVNEGIKAARTPYVLLLNNDTEIQKNFIEVLWKTIKKSECIFSVEGKMLQYGNEGKIDSAGTFYNALGWAFARGKDCAEAKYETKCEVFAACAGAALYRKSVFEKIGSFDEQYFAYLEDIDIGYRAKLHGYQNIYEPKARVLHVGSGTSGSRYNAFKVRYSARNNIYLIYKNMPVVQRVLNAPLLACGFGVKLLFFVKKGFAKEYVQGIREGITLCKKMPKQKEQCALCRYVRVQFELWRNVVRKRW